MPNPKPCGWPFHNKPDCEECQQWETKASMNLEAYLQELDQRRQEAHAARAARHKTTPPTQSA